MYILIWHLTHIFLNICTESESNHIANHTVSLLVLSLITVSYAVLKSYENNNCWLENIAVFTV